MAQVFGRHTGAASNTMINILALALIIVVSVLLAIISREMPAAVGWVSG